MTYLKDIIDIERFELFVRNGLITTRNHPDDELLSVYSYGKRVQFEGIWTPETRLARGLMLQFETADDYSTARVVGRGIPKFFTIEQAGDDWSAMKLVDDDEGVTVDEMPVIPMDAPAYVANKLNGALGLAYITPKGSIAISTKGSFSSLEASIGTRLIEDKLSNENSASVRSLIRSGYTPLFEIITPERPHPVDYGDLEDIVYLGMVAHADGYFFTPKDYDLFSELGFDSAQKMPYGTLREAVEAPYVPNTEGMVVSINENGVQHLFKVKPEEYLSLRKMFYSVRPKDLNELLLSMSGEEISKAKSWEDMNLGIAEKALGKGHAKLARSHKETMFSMVSSVKETVSEAYAVYNDIVSKTDGSRKEIALAIKNQGYDHSLLFAIMKDKLEENYLVYAVAMKGLVKNN